MTSKKELRTQIERLQARLKASNENMDVHWKRHIEIEEELLKVKRKNERLLEAIRGIKNVLSPMLDTTTWNSINLKDDL